jgi:hypothetical protein
LYPPEERSHRKRSAQPSEISNPPTPAASNAAFALQGTALLTKPVTDDIREEQRQQIIRYFQSQIAATPAKRDALWRPDFSSLARTKPLSKASAHLREMLGFVEPKLGNSANQKPCTRMRICGLRT